MEKCLNFSKIIGEYYNCLWSCHANVTNNKSTSNEGIYIIPVRIIKNVYDRKMTVCFKKCL